MIANRLCITAALSCILLVLTASCKSHRTSSPSPTVSHDPAFTEFFRRTNGWISGDGAITVPLSDGRVLWLFGDSHIDTFDPTTGTVPCLFQSRSAALLQDKGSFRAKTLVSSGPGFRSYFKRGTSDDPWFWPLWGFQEKKDVYVYLSELHQQGTGNFGFASTGHDYFARITLPDMKVAEYIPLADFKGDGFGSGFVRNGDGYIYTYNMKGTKTGSEVRVARFKPNAPVRDWTFWNGTNWSANVAHAATIARTPAVSLSVSKVRNKYLLIGSALSVACDMGRDIYMATSDSPIGPFTTPKVVYTIDATLEGHYPFFYMPVAHPEFINAKDELLVTYSINGYDPCVKTCINGHMNPDHYRPRAIRVPLKLIDPTFK